MKITDKKNTLRSKEFKDLKRLALMRGKLAQASEEMFSSELHTKGMIHFTEALAKMNKISHEKWQGKKQELIKSAVTQLGIDAYRNNKKDIIQFYKMLEKTQNIK